LHVIKKLYYLGAKRNTDILAGLTVSTTENLDGADFVLLTAYMDEGEDLHQYDDFLKKAQSLKLPFICANPDKEISNGPKLRYCAGVIAEKYEKLGGTVYYYGKPHPAIYETAQQILKEQGIIDKSKLLMIGDTLETDILGARNVGIDSALVLEGNTARLLAMAGQGVSDPFKAEKYLKQHFEKINLYPTWVLSAIA
jgi:HAD superfamily hydrolase (TIGR01459 family)